MLEVLLFLVMLTACITVEESSRKEFPAQAKHCPNAVLSLENGTEESEEDLQQLVRSSERCRVKFGPTSCLKKLTKTAEHSWQAICIQSKENT